MFTSGFVVISFKSSKTINPIEESKMGLDIYASKNVKLIDNPTVNDAEDLDQIYHGDFPKQAGELVDRGYYDCEDSEHFLRMGYGRYGVLRNEIARIAGYKKTDIDKPDFRDEDYLNKYYFYKHPYLHDVYEQENGAFSELIIFSDCEGYICSTVCKKLYSDFEQFLDAAKAGLDDHWFEGYENLMAAFKYGSENGYARYT
jgi:hypothetical protein